MASVAVPAACTSARIDAYVGNERVATGRITSGNGGAAQTLGQCRRSLGLAVNQPHLLRDPDQRRQAPQQFGVVGVTGQAVEHDDLGLHRELPAEDAHLRLTFDQRVNPICPPIPPSPLSMKLRKPSATLSDMPGRAPANVCGSQSHCSCRSSPGPAPPDIVAINSVYRMVHKKVIHRETSVWTMGIRIGTV